MPDGTVQYCDRQLDRKRHPSAETLTPTVNSTHMMVGSSEGIRQARPRQLPLCGSTGDSSEWVCQDCLIRRRVLNHQRLWWVPGDGWVAGRPANGARTFSTCHFLAIRLRLRPLKRHTRCANDILRDRKAPLVDVSTVLYHANERNRKQPTWIDSPRFARQSRGPAELLVTTTL